MRKFAAHYLLTPTGRLLKNGIALAKDNGTIQWMDTKGQVDEYERMIFHSGLLLEGFEFQKMPGSALHFPPPENSPSLFNQFAHLNRLSLNEWVELAKQLQVLQPEMDMVKIIEHMEQELKTMGYEKKTIPGLYLLSGMDLGNLRFKDKTSVKKIV